MEQSVIRQPLSRSDRLPYLMWMLVAAAYAVLLWPSLVSMAAIWWRSDTYAHGMLVPLISGWLIFRQRQELARLPIRTCWWALLPLLGCALLWLLGRSADLLVIEQLAAVALIPVTVLLLAGTRLFSALLFPLGYLFFAVPFGEELTPWLQQVTAEISVLALQLTGIPVYVNGLFIEIPGGRFEVAEACSGIRYLIASLAVGTLYGYLTFEKLPKRLLFALAALLVPILANGLRAYLIIIIAYLSSMKYATGVDHLIYGWLFFGVVMMFLFWVGSFWRDPPAVAASGARPTTAARPASTLAAVLSVLFVLGSLTAFDRLAQHPVPAESSTGAELQLTGWVAAPPPQDWSPEYSNPDRSLLIRYQADAPVDLYVADYLSEEQDKELINRMNRLYNDHWTVATTGSRALPVAGHSLQLNTTEIRHFNGSRRLVWYWYEIADRPLHQGWRVKLVQALHRLRGQHPLSRVYIVSTPYEPGSAAEQRLIDFISASWPQLARQR